jgi:hypothetical protein
MSTAERSLSSVHSSRMPSSKTEVKQYVRTVQVQVTELVPDKDNLPRCVAWIWDATQCRNKARYNQNGQEVCGQHVGRPGLMFMPDKYRRP